MNLYNKIYFFTLFTFIIHATHASESASFSLLPAPAHVQPMEQWQQPTPQEIMHAQHILARAAIAHHTSPAVQTAWENLENTLKELKAEDEDRIKNQHNTIKQRCCKVIQSHRSCNLACICIIIPSVCLRLPCVAGYVCCNNKTAKKGVFCCANDDNDYR